MMNDSISLFSLLILLSLSFCLSSTQSTDPNLTAPTPAHVELSNYGFPVGLLPTSIRSYTINSTTGAFSVELDGACKITLPPDNYLATYSPMVHGKIVKGRIAELDGIRVRAMFRWWGITGIKATADELVFEVGVVSAKYPVKNFDESPVCEGNVVKRSSS